MQAHWADGTDVSLTVQAVQANLYVTVFLFSFFSPLAHHWHRCGPNNYHTASMNHDHDSRHQPCTQSRSYQFRHACVLDVQELGVGDWIKHGEFELAMSNSSELAGFIYFELTFESLPLSSSSSVEMFISEAEERWGALMVWMRNICHKSGKTPCGYASGIGSSGEDKRQRTSKHVIRKSTDSQSHCTE